MLIDPTSGLGYANGQRLTSADMTTIATQQPDAIDGVGGGTYAPSTQIIIGGSGFRCTSNTDLTGTVAISGTTTCTASATFSGALTQINNLASSGHDASGVNTFVSGATVSFNSASTTEFKSGSTITFTSTPTFATIPTLTSQSVTRIQQLTPVDKNSWTWYTSALGWIQNSASDFLYIPIENIPDNASLVSIRVMLKGGAGAGGNYSALPAGLPTLKVEYVDNSGAVQAPTPTATDGSASVGAFNAVHSITCTLTTPLAIAMSSSRQAIYARIDGVTTGYEANKLGILQLDALFTCTKINP